MAGTNDYAFIADAVADGFDQPAVAISPYRTEEVIAALNIITEMIPLRKTMVVGVGKGADEAVGLLSEKEKK